MENQNLTNSSTGVELPATESVEDVSRFEHVTIELERTEASTGSVVLTQVCWSLDPVIRHRFECAMLPPFS